MKRIILSFCAFAVLTVSAQQTAPEPVYPVPTPQQVEWQKMETYAFAHFGMNTMNNMEWGTGATAPETFNPSALDCSQWVSTLRKAGLKAVIITAKHHDGFCLWPTRWTDYSLRNSPYKDGKGDVVGELSKACREQGLKFGVYLSPWDRHQAFYATPLYNMYYEAQLKELLTQYGEIFEIWFDGANGGDGYYGGTWETRHIDNRTYYNFPRLDSIVQALQPHAIIFSDAGPGCRWVGNEKGFADPTNWSFLRQKDVFIGYDKASELTTGHPDGDAWIPAECDVSIRPGWFWHEKENNQVRTVDNIVDLYYKSVGRNATLLLNIPPTKEGLIYKTDSINLIRAFEKIRAELKTDLLRGAKVKASSTRGKAFQAMNTQSADYDQYWATKDGQTSGTLTYTFKRPTRLNRLMLQEYIPLGQRVKAFRVEYLCGREWHAIDFGEPTTTIGYKRLLRFPTIETRALRIVFLDARGPLCINHVGAYLAKQY